MFEHICCICSNKFTTEIPWNREVEPICFPCAMDQLEEDE